jgi:hypothetical protein
MSTGRKDTRASPTGHGHQSRSTDSEVASADFQVADARAHVERWTRHVEDEMRRGSAATHSREILASFQEILREMITRRDAVVVEFMKGKPKTESDLAKTG